MSARILLLQLRKLWITTPSSFRELVVCTPEQRDLETGINFEELISKKWSHSEILLTSQIEEKMIKHSISTGQGLKTGFDPAALQAKALEDGGKSTCGFHDEKCMLCFAFTLNSALLCPISNPPAAVKVHV